MRKGFSFCPQNPSRVKNSREKICLFYEEE
nr:MAG TPA: hypothetical protein [Caudoviricetes sp.]DAR00098.1 MAG TPA: hypothetical protein [Caudoviricetes sp.]